jgi:hypothetical protein
MLAVLMILACGGSGDSEQAAQVDPGWTEGLWGGRALTVRAGLDESLGMAEEGDSEGAAELAMQVYEGSFEPELEPAIRAVLGRRAAAALEFRFGIAVDQLRGEARGDAGVADLLESLDEAAARLDEQKVGLR